MRTWLWLIISFLLASCASTHSYYPQGNPLQGNWQRDVVRNTKGWTRGADHWFLTGDPNYTEVANRKAPYSTAMSSMMVKVPDFTRIKVNGNFQVQLFGTTEHNTVNVFGPNADVRLVAVTIRKGTLCVEQIAPQANLSRVIIRIGVVNLQHLEQQGPGTIEGVQLYSSGLHLISTNRGNVYLRGQFQLKEITQLGYGQVTVLDAISSHLNIYTQGGGSVNVSGQLGMQSIVHHGRTQVSLIGIRDQPFSIDADGIGKISLLGEVNLAQVRGGQYICIVAEMLKTHELHLFLFDAARIGFGGYAERLYVQTNDKSIFYGSALAANEAFVVTHHTSQANILADKRAYLKALDRSRIYYFGRPETAYLFPHNDGRIMLV